MTDRELDHPEPICWQEELGAAITVADETGRIVAMNRRAAETFAAEGGRALLGSDVFACHPEPARSLLREMYAERRANHYTISKQGQRKIIHQMPVFEGGVFRGFVEISIPIPAELPHFDRG